MAAKVVTGTSKYDSSTAALKTLHWLAIRLRIEFKIFILVFKCVHCQALIYLSNLVNPNVTVGRPRPALWKEKVTFESTFY